MEENNIINWYFIGVLAAFLIGLLKVVISLNIRFSIKANNFKKVNCYYHYFSGTFLPEKPSRFSFPFFLIYLLILAPIFSWISVLSATWMFIRAKTNKVQMPDRLKDIIFKFSTVNLPKEDVIELQKEWGKILGVNVPVYTGQSEDYEGQNILDLSRDKDTTFVLTLDPIRQVYETYYRFDLSRSKSFYEYKFLEGKILTRLIEDDYEDAGVPKEIRVKDNVVMEDVIRKDEGSWFGKKHIEERIDRYKKDVEWHEVDNYKVKFFIMAKHPDVFPSIEYRKAVRSELERIKNGNSKIIELGEKAGFVYGEDGYGGNCLRYPDNCDDLKKKEMDLKLPKIEDFNMDWDEFSTAKERINYLKKLLGEEIKPSLSDKT